MKIRSTHTFVLFCTWLLSSQPGEAATPLTKVMMTSGSASERDGVVYVAQDQGFFKKYGLDVSFVQVRNGPVAMSALSSGETQFHWGSVSGANLGAIAEGADLGVCRRVHQSAFRHVRRQRKNKNADGVKREKHRS